MAVEFNSAAILVSGPEPDNFPDRAITGTVGGMQLVAFHQAVAHATRHGEDVVSHENIGSAAPYRVQTASRWWFVIREEVFPDA